MFCGGRNQSGDVWYWKALILQAFLGVKLFSRASFDLAAPKGSCSSLGQALVFVNAVILTLEGEGFSVTAKPGNLADTMLRLAFSNDWSNLEQGIDEEARAVQTLGKQWTYAARVIKGHELITQSPYGVVRNAIYLGMFGLILSTCNAMSFQPGRYRSHLLGSSFLSPYGAFFDTSEVLSREI